MPPPPPPPDISPEIVLPPDSPYAQLSQQPALESAPQPAPEPVTQPSTMDFTATNAVQTTTSSPIESPSTSHFQSPRLLPLPRRAEPPTHESIIFETGNPDTGAIISGTLHISALSPESSTLLMESVPGLMTAAEMCNFVKPSIDSIVHLRALRQASERNRYLVAIRFKDTAHAVAFAHAFRGKPYLRGLIPETCAVRSVHSITFTSTARSSSPSRAKSKTKHNTQVFPNGAMFPRDITRDITHPFCAVCLERLDNHASALVTTFCNHTMHAACLGKWDLNRCPVCRHTHELTPEASVCMQCEQRDNLWMCVVCAFVGCGYYKSKHAQMHFAETQHPFAMNISDCTFWTGDTLSAGTVWDYVSERFVNRLASGDDGKIVEVDSRPNGGEITPGDGAAASSVNHGNDSCCSGSTRDGVVYDVENDRGVQAAVYASRMDAVVDEYRRQLESLQTEHVTECNRLQQEIEMLRMEVANGSKERKSLLKRVNDSDKEKKNLQDKNGFLKSLNETLLRDKQGWNEQVERLREELKESETSKSGLEEQLRDVMMHMEAQAKISGGESCRSDASELHGGDVLRVGPSPRKRLAMKTNRRYSGA